MTYLIGLLLNADIRRTRSSWSRSNFVSTTMMPSSVRYTDVLPPSPRITYRSSLILSTVVTGGGGFPPGPCACIAEDALNSNRHGIVNSAILSDCRCNIYIFNRMEELLIGFLTDKRIPLGGNGTGNQLRSHI